MASKVKAANMVTAIIVEQGLSNNQAFAKCYNEVYRNELERIKGLDIKKNQSEVQLFFKIKQVFTLLDFETWNDE